jgi:hypothetical protein
MSDAAISAIRVSRDAALQSLDQAFDAVGDLIAQTTQIGPYLDALTKRYEDIRRERDAIFRSATDAVLALPSVTAAAATLNGLAENMTKRAAELRDATKLLMTAGALVSLGQQFADVIAKAQGS